MTSSIRLSLAGFSPMGMDCAIPDTDSEYGAPVGIFVQRGKTMGQNSRVPRNYVGHAGCQFHPFGAVGEQGQGHEGIAEYGLGISNPDTAEPQGFGAGHPVDKIR